MSNKALVIVGLSVNTEREAEFNQFYHHQYIPNIMRVIPELKLARRYQEHNVEGSLRYYNKKYLTIYECASEAMAQKALEAIKNRPGREKERVQWNEFQASSLYHLESACIYTQTYAHRRVALESHWGSRPFFMVSVEVQPDQQKQFDAWYEQDYLPKNIADVPTWTACRRYTSQGKVPTRQLTIYEAADLAGLQTSLELMRSYHRLQENASWKQWDTGENPAITWEEASSFKPIFRYPD